MKKLLIIFLALGSFSSFAGFSTRVSESMNVILSSNEYNDFINNKSPENFVGIKYRGFGTQQNAYFSLQVYVPFKGKMKICDHDVNLVSNSVTISNKMNCERDNNNI